MPTLRGLYLLPVIGPVTICQFQFCCDGGVSHTLSRRIFSRRRIHAQALLAQFGISGLLDIKLHSCETIILDLRAVQSRKWYRGCRIVYVLVRYDLLFHLVFLASLLRLGHLTLLVALIVNEVHLVIVTYPVIVAALLLRNWLGLRIGGI